MSENNDFTNKNRSENTKTMSIPEPERVARLDPTSIVAIHKLAYLFEKMHLTEYLTYMKKPGKVIWLNFVAGLSRGLGFAFGMTVLFGLMLYLLGRMVDLPLIGQWIAKIVEIVNQEIDLGSSSFPNGH